MMYVGRVVLCKGSRDLCMRSKMIDVGSRLECGHAKNRVNFGLYTASLSFSYRTW